LPLTIRAPTVDELISLSDLCFRSKAVWDYDKEFMEACHGELSFTPRDLQLTLVAVAEHDGKPIGVAQVKAVDDEADIRRTRRAWRRRRYGANLRVWPAP
jgi:hypothetical protein